jgi:hypothetical protein
MAKLSIEAQEMCKACAYENHGVCGQGLSVTERNINAQRGDCEEAGIFVNSTDGSVIIPATAHKELDTWGYIS